MHCCPVLWGFLRKKTAWIFFASGLDLDSTAFSFSVKRLCLKFIWVSLVMMQIRKGRVHVSVSVWSCWFKPIFSISISYHIPFGSCKSVTANTLESLWLEVWHIMVTIQEVGLLYLCEGGPKHPVLPNTADLLMLELPLVLKKGAQHPEDRCSLESLALKPVRERKIGKKTKS